MAAGNFDRVCADAIAQVAAGAQMLDVNAGIPLADEPEILAEAIRVVQSVTDVPLSIDSSIVAARERGLAVYRGKPLVNSVTGEEKRLEAVLPLVAKHKAAVVGVANDETGISEDPDKRFEVARRIVKRAESYGISRNAITNPLEDEIRKGILAANVMMGHDENCQGWLAAHRSSNEDSDSERAARRARRKARQ